MTTKRYLFALWEGGGTLPPELGVASRLIERGHEVLVIADPTVEDDAQAAGCTFTPWSAAPSRTSLDPDQDPMKDWEVSNPLTMIRRARDGMIAGPASDYAADTRRAIQGFDPDAVVADHLLAGAIMGAQAEGVPVATVVPNIWMMPTDGAPAVGPGFAFPASAPARLRNHLMTRLVNRVFDRALPTINDARRKNGLPELDAFYDQFTKVDRILVLSSPTFDFSSEFVPANARYVGPILDDPHWASAWRSPWPADDPRPLVLASLSSTFQDQVELLQKIIEGLATIPVRGVVTLGQNVHLGELAPAGDVHIVQSAPHSPILQEAAVAVSHCGHGGTMKALAAGVPLVCLPMGRDQNDNAARVVHQGAGVRLRPSSAPSDIAAAVMALLDDPTYRRQASRMAETIARETDDSQLISELEALANTGVTAV